MDEDRWAPPDPAHRMTQDTDASTIRRIRASWHRQNQMRHATTRGPNDTRIIVALVIAVTVGTVVASNRSGDVTLDDVPGLSPAEARP